MQYYKIVKQDELYHHGIKGQKWGVRRTLAQLGHKVKAAKTKHNRKKALEKARVVRQEKSKKKKEILAKGSAKELYKNKDLFTNKELEKAMSRIKVETSLQTMATNEGRMVVQNGKNNVSGTLSKAKQAQVTMDKLTNYMNTVNNFTGAGIKMYGRYKAIKTILNKTQQTSQQKLNNNKDKPKDDTQNKK